MAPEVPGQWERLSGAILANGLNSTLVLDNCTLVDIQNSAEVVARFGALVYSDDPGREVRSRVPGFRSYTPEATQFTPVHFAVTYACTDVCTDAALHELAVVSTQL